MSNIRKSFNFRNGVQVDETNFIVNSNGLVGIGTSIPSEALDVKGNAVIDGTLTAGRIVSEDVVIANTTIDSLSIGIVSITSGIITSSSGIVTYYGDGGKLLNLPTSQWVDVDSGFGYTSIYAAGNVGVGTTYPDYTFQVGGTPGIKEGFGVDEVGNVYFTGIITAGSTAIIGNDLIVIGIGSFGDYITTPNYLSVGSGTTIGGGLIVGGGATFANSISVGDDITVSGSGYIVDNLLVGSATTVTGSLDVGNGAEITGDIDLTGSVRSGGIGTFQTLYSNDDIFFKGDLNFTEGQINWNGGYISEIDTKIYGSLGVGGATTIGSFLTVGGNATLGINLSVGNNLTVGTSGTFGGNLFVSGLATVTQGLTVGGRSVINGFDIGGVLGNRLSFNNPGDLELDSLSGTVLINDDLVVTGFTSVSLGSTIRDIQVAISGENIINTSSGNLVLDSAGGIVQTNVQLNADNGILADNNIGIGTLNFNTINTLSGDLRLDSSTRTVGINSNLSVSGNATIRNIKIGVVDSNTIDTSSGDLKLDSSSGNVLVDNNLVVGSGATIGIVQFGLTDPNTIDTTLGDLILSSFSGLVKITNLEVSGITSFIGGTTLTGGITLDNNLRLGVSNNDTIDTVSSDLILDSFTGLVQVISNFNVSGFSTFTGEIASSTIKSSDGVTVGNNLRLGVTNNSTINTISGNLTLDSFSNLVNIDSNLSVSGISTFNSLVDINDDLLVRDYIQVGVNSLTSISNALVLGSSTGETFINDNLTITDSLTVNNNLTVSGGLNLSGNLVLTGISTVSNLSPQSSGSGSVGQFDNIFAESYFVDTNTTNLYASNIYSIGFASSEASIGNINIGIGTSNKIESISEDLILNSITGNVKIPNDLILINDLIPENNIFINSSNKFIGLGTELSDYNLDIKSSGDKTIRIGNQTNDYGVSLGYLSSQVPAIVLGLGEIGSAKSVGYVSHNGNDLKIGNTDYGDIDFLLDDSEDTLPLVTTIENVVSYAGTIGINTTIITGIQTTNLEVGYGVVEISGILTTGTTIIGFSDSPEKIEISAQTENIGIITEQLFGFTREVVGYANTGSFRWINGRTNATLASLTYNGTFNIINELYTPSLVSNSDEVSVTRLSSTGPISFRTLYVEESVGIGSTIPSCIADFSGKDLPVEVGLGSDRFMLPPIITDSQRIGLTTVAGAMIFNSTTNKHQAYDGTTWHDLY